MYTILKNNQAIRLLTPTDRKRLKSSSSYSPDWRCFRIILTTATNSLAATCAIDGTYICIEEVFIELDTKPFFRFIVSLLPVKNTRGRMTLESGDMFHQHSFRPALLETKPTSSLPSYVNSIGTSPYDFPYKVILFPPLNHHQSSISEPTIVTALITGDKKATPNTTGAMRTLMYTRTLPDGTLSIIFDPPVGRWLPLTDSFDVNLRLWYSSTTKSGGLRGRPLDLLPTSTCTTSPISNTTEIKIRKLNQHDYRKLETRPEEGCIEETFLRQSQERVEPNVFLVVKHIHVTPPCAGKPPPPYWYEGESLFQLRDIKEVTRKHEAALKIQSVWRNVISCPESIVCRNRLMREFKDFS